jgi:hypothetical protein
MKLLITTQVYENYGYRWKAKGGNDYEIFEDPRTIGHHVDGPDDTITIINQLFDLCRPTE